MTKNKNYNFREEKKSVRRYTNFILFCKLLKNRIFSKFQLPSSYCLGVEVADCSSNWRQIKSIVFLYGISSILIGDSIVQWKYLWHGPKLVKLGHIKGPFKAPWIGTLFKNLGKAHFGEIDIGSHDGYGIYLPLRLLKGLHKIKFHRLFLSMILVVKVAVTICR